MPRNPFLIYNDFMTALLFFKFVCRYQLSENEVFVSIVDLTVNCFEKWWQYHFKILFSENVICLRKMLELFIFRPASFLKEIFKTVFLDWKRHAGNFFSQNN